MRNNTALLLWRRCRVCLVAGLLVIYSMAIWLDLPSPAGTQYAQDLPPSTLASWGAKPVPSAQHAANWLDKTQALRGWSVYPEGWFWPKLTAAPLLRWLPLLGLGLLGAAGLYLTQRGAALRSGSATKLALMTLVVFAYVLQLVTLSLKSPNVQQLLVARITDWDFSGYFNSAVEIPDLAAFFWKYDSIIRSSTFCSHCKTHPPGPVLFYWLLLHAVYHLAPAWQQSLRDSLLAIAPPLPLAMPSAWIIVALVGGHLILLSAAAIVIPLYGLARQLAEPELALPLTALGAVLPGLVLMSPEFDQLYGTLAAGLFYLALRGLRTPQQSGRWGCAAGLLFAFCLYWSFGLWVLTIPLVLIAIMEGARSFYSRAQVLSAAANRMLLHAVIPWLLGFGLGTSVPWLLLWSLGGFNLPSVLRAASHVHLRGITAVRPYAPWLVFNLVDYLQFAGLPLILATVLIFARRPSGATPPAPATQRVAGYWASMRIQLRRAVPDLSLNFYGVLFWGMLAALDLSGTTRAEVGRLWIFLTPLALLTVYHAAGRGQLAARHIYALLAAQFLVCGLLGGCWLTP